MYISVFIFYFSEQKVDMLGMHQYDLISHQELDDDDEISITVDYEERVFGGKRKY